MDFFAQQDRARRKTWELVFYFCLAVATTILMVYFAPLIIMAMIRIKLATTGPPIQWWHPTLFTVVCSITLIVVLCGAAYQISRLRRDGGEGVAAMLGGKQIPPATHDFFERRLLNIVEEMAIASGVPAPPVYVLPKEKGINAFAAGFTPSDAVVAVTYGTMTGLSRDELQGVMAHEFSHILNSDMAININLMGFLHGLLVIGLSGRLLLEVGSESHDDKGGFPIACAGLGLMAVGFSGVLFGKLIKSAISRSRERLADASAVQFTRNPAGLASALKKVGGLSTGSRLLTPHAEQASHMFFCNGLRFSFFNTHPPLKERVQWLDPTFNGSFPPITYGDLRKQLERYEGAPKKEEKEPGVVELFTDPAKLVAAATVLDSINQPAFSPNNPEALIDSIGAPMEKHAEAAKWMIASIPEPIKAHARNPYNARMLVYYLLLDAEPSVRDKQLVVIREQAEPEVSRVMEKALLDIGPINPEMRLPIIDLAIPALRFLSPDQYADFRCIIKELVEADKQTNVFEYMLQRVLLCHLDPVFSGESKSRTTNYYAIRGLEQETSVVLSALAWKGHGNEFQASLAFHGAVEKIAAPKATLTLLPETECTWAALDVALDKFCEASFRVKKWLLAGALECLMHDREITVEEVELFRAVADTLGCPVPPWVTPVTL